MKELRRKTAPGVTWRALGAWGSQLSTLVVFIVLTRLLEPEAFGLVAMATVFTSLMAVFAEQGFGQAIVQRQDLELEHLDTALWTNVIVGGGLTLLGVLVSRLVAQVYGEPQLRPVVALLSVTFLLTGLSSTQRALLQRELDFRALSTRQLAASIAGGFLGILVAGLGGGVYALVAKSLFTSLVLMALFWQASEWRPRLRFSYTHLRNLAGFGLSMVGIRLTNYLRLRLDDFLIGYFLGAQALGYYTVAYRLGRLTLDLFSGVMGSVAVAAFARLQSKLRRLGRALTDMTGISSLITFPIFTTLIVLAPDLILALSGPQWLRSAPAMRILTLGGFLLSLQYFLDYLLIAIGQPGRLFSLNVLVTLATAAGFIITAPFGIEYVAAAYVVVNGAFFGAYLYLVQQSVPLDVRRYLAAGLRPLLPSALLGAFLYAINSVLAASAVNVYVRLVLSGTAGALIYSGAVYLFQPSAFLELRSLALALLPLGRRPLWDPEA
ncbi:MAG: lipopolysaccharide biosynthesis protein [Candidatus Promineifilaceae bacterium]|nr:lipopolysaccharide biosynthesis protein [Candidatus Promineifilaceae bacterium]